MKDLPKSRWSRRIAFCATGAGLLVACDFVADAPDARQLSTAAALAGRDRPEPTGSGRLARLVPTFGGAVVEPPGGTRLIVYLTDLANAVNAKSLIERDLAAHGRPELSVTFRQGRYPFTQLESWRDALMLGYSAGVVRGEIDERANMVRIGITRESARAAVLQAAARLNVPAGALSVVVAQAPTPFTSLRDKIRPMLAGLQIATDFTDQNGVPRGGICTYGPTVLKNNVTYMVTNGHCVAYPLFGGWIGAWVSQATIQYHPPSNYFGTVVRNPALFSCAPGLCRYSDAALVQLLDTGTQAVGSDTTTRRGYIARPTSRATMPTIYGLVTIDPANPIVLSGLMPDVFVGDTIEKVGRTTGWTAGVVVNTSSVVCDTVVNSGCRVANVTVNAGVGHGDSGSPTFWKGSAGAYHLAGLLWGGISNQPLDSTGSGDTLYYSKWVYVDDDLGPGLYVDSGTPPPPPPPTLAVTITGPSPIRPNATCTWAANASGGSQPYSYAWTVDGGAAGDGSSTLTYQAGTSSFTVGVTVTDQLNGTASNTKSVLVSSSAPQCPQI